jgi:hypothetical protein
MNGQKNKSINMKLIHAFTYKNDQIIIRIRKFHKYLLMNISLQPKVSIFNQIDMFIINVLG